LVILVIFIGWFAVLYVGLLFVAVFTCAENNYKNFQIL